MTDGTKREALARIMAARQQYSNVDVAKHFGLGQSTVSHLANGSRPMTDKVAARIMACKPMPPRADLLAMQPEPAATALDPVALLAALVADETDPDKRRALVGAMAALVSP